MATYGLNDMGSFFHSEIQDLGHDLDPYDQDYSMEVEEVFSDAVEHQAQYDGSMEDSKSELLTNTATSDAYNVATSYPAPTQAPLLPEETTSEYNHAPVQKAEQSSAPFACSGEAPYNSYDKPEDTIKVDRLGAHEKYTAAYHNAIKTSFPTSQDQHQHASGCDGTRGASTPPATPPPELPLSSQTDAKSEAKSPPKSQATSEGKPWLGPDDLRDVAKAVLHEQRWHEKVAHLHPRVHLASHRYWIGVLNPGHNPKNACKEEHFTWMKGNRLTTAETVSKIYAATTMLEGVFMMGGERPELQDRMEELDLFNDKVVIFKVAKEGTPGSVGRLVTEGLVTKEIEVIELDD
ncbi:hypothetical protein Q7P35_008570 [Cladosporium inversicolor]